MAIDVDFLVEDLIESVKDRSFAPISQSTFEDEDIVRILNEEQLRVVAKIIKVREDFFYSRSSTAMTAGKDHYLIPAGASGNALTALFWVDSGGNKRLLTRRDVSRIGEYSSGQGESSSFYFEGDEIVLMNPPGGGDSLLFVYSRRPNRLILTESCLKITGVTSALGTTEFTVDRDPTVDFVVADQVDFIRATSPFTIWSEQVAITAIGTGTVSTLTADVVDVDGVTVEPGNTDYIAPTGYTNIPMLPIEFHSVLAQRGACRLLASMGDLNKWNAGMSELKQLEDDALDIIKNRAECSPERPSKKNGLLRSFRSW